MDISLVLATSKRADILNRTLASFSHLESGELQWDLWVVDNADDPQTRKLCASWAQHLPLRYLVEICPGKNNALNRAVTKVLGQLVVFTDDDVIANPDWLIQLWQGVLRWPDHHLFGGRIMAEWPDGVPLWGNDHPLNQSLFSLHCPAREEKTYGEGDFLPYGPNMAVRHEIFTLGYRFNPDIGPTNAAIYRMGSETEFLQRLKDDGYIPVFLPQAVVKHQIRPEQLTSVGLNRRNFRIGLSNITSESKSTRSILGCAPYLWKQLAQVQWARAMAYITGNALNLFETNCRSWRIRGKMFGQRHHCNRQIMDILQKILAGE